MVEQETEKNRNKVLSKLIVLLNEGHLDRHLNTLGFPSDDAGLQTSYLLELELDALVLEGEAPEHAGQEDLEFEESHAVADADARTGGEDQAAVPSCGGELVLVGELVGVLGEPAIGAEDVGVVPAGGDAVHAEDGEEDSLCGWERISKYERIERGMVPSTNLALLDAKFSQSLAVGGGDGVAKGKDVILGSDALSLRCSRVHAERFFGHGIQQRQLGSAHVFVEGRFPTSMVPPEVGKLLADLSLKFGLPCEFKKGVVDCAGCGFVASDDEGNDVVEEFIFSETVLGDRCLDCVRGNSFRKLCR